MWLYKIYIVVFMGKLESISGSFIQEQFGNFNVVAQPCVCFIFPPSDASTLNEPVLQGQVEKLNRQNTEHSHGKAEADNKQSDDRGSERRRQEPAELILDEPDTSVSEEREKTTREGEEEEEEDKDIFEDSDSEEEAENGNVEDDGKEKYNKEKEESSKSETSQSVTADICKTSLLPLERYFFLFFFICACYTTVNYLAEGEKNTESINLNVFFFGDISFTFIALRRLVMLPLAANVASQKKTW